MAAAGITADRTARDAPATLRAACGTTGESLFLPGWSDDDWRRLLDQAQVRTVPAGEALIRGGAPRLPWRLDSARRGMPP